MCKFYIQALCFSALVTKLYQSCKVVSQILNVKLLLSPSLHLHPLTFIPEVVCLDYNEEPFVINKEI